MLGPVSVPNSCSERPSRVPTLENAPSGELADGFEEFSISETATSRPRALSDGSLRDLRPSQEPPVRPLSKPAKKDHPEARRAESAESRARRAAERRARLCSVAVMFGVVL